MTEQGSGSMASPRDTLERIDRAWEQLWAYLDGASADARMTDRWDVKDVMAHLARWEETARIYIEEHLAGREPQGVDSTEVNDSWAEEDRRLSATEAEALLRTAHTRLLERLRSLGDEQWDEKVRSTVEGNTYGHYEEHLGYAADHSKGA
jgi:hypothetical protein